MAVILNMTPVDKKQNTVLQNANNKDGTKNRKSEVGFAKALHSETNKSDIDVDSKLKSNDATQFMASMAGMVVPVIANLTTSVAQVVGNTADTSGGTASVTQVQLANAVSAMPQVQLANAVPVIPQVQLANAVSVMPQVQLANAVPVIPQVQLANAVPVIPQVQLANAVPVIPQAHITNAVPGDIGLAALLPQGTTVNIQVDNTQLGEFAELKAQTQLQMQNKPILEQVEKIGVPIKNTEMLTNDPVLSQITPSLTTLGNANILGRNSNKQFEGKKIVVSQINDLTAEAANNSGLVETVNIKTVLAPQVAVNVVDKLSSENKENADVSLPNQTIKNPDIFASMLNQQGIKFENKTKVEVKQESSQQVSDSYNITSQIVDQTRLVTGAKNTEMIIKLKPEHLGELTFKVTVENGVVSASFHSNNTEVRSMIESSLHQLKQELSNQGLKIDNVGVYAGLGQFFSNGQQSEGYQQPVIKVRNQKAEEDFLDVVEATNSADKVLDVTGVDYRA